MNTNPKAKRILCYGDSNTWGWVPSKMGQERFLANERWTGILQDKLGSDWEVIEESLGGRNTITEDERAGFEERNGLRTLPIILETHLPLDKVVIMLGTTELKEMFNLSAKEIAKGLQMLIKTVKKYRALAETQVPEIIVVIPPVIIDTTEFAAVLFKGGTDKSKELIRAYEKVCREEDVVCIDSNEVVEVNQTEGIHLDEKAHEKLGNFIYKKIDL
jgi:lysophospholipase L1-like esterase